MHENRDDMVVEDGSTPVEIREHAQPVDEPVQPVDEPVQPVDEPAMPFDGFEEPADKASEDHTQECAPDGIDPGDARYIGRPVHVDFETGAVTEVDPPTGES